ncbi:MAG: hypothetical protein HC809_07340 [Gammaproteobacteria bacterium]|nr:hypothetical protein [Gammaproteobacteria bacterium]
MGSVSIWQERPFVLNDELPGKFELFGFYGERGSHDDVRGHMRFELE